MFGLGSGLDPKKMQAMMKQLGMKQEEIEASRVVIEKSDNNKMIIENPSVIKITMQGQEMFQVTGEPHEESNEESISEEDIKTVMEKTGVDKNRARAALEASKGDLAEAIMSFTE